MAKILKSGGSSLDKLVKVNIYLTDLKKDFVPMNEVYTEVSYLIRSWQPLYSSVRGDQLTDMVPSRSSSSRASPISRRALALELQPFRWAQTWRLSASRKSMTRSNGRGCRKKSWHSCTCTKSLRAT